MRRWFVISMTMTALLFAMPAFADPAPQSAVDPQSEEISLGTRPSTPLLVSGAIVGGLSYGLPFAISLTYFALIWPFQAAFGDPTPPDTILWMMVPLVGPIFAANTDFGRRNTDVRSMFYIDAGLQFVGLGLVLSSFVFREEIKVERHSLRLGPGPAGSAGLTVEFDLR